MESQLVNIHPILWWLFAIASVSVAVGAIWRVWLGSVVRATRDAVESAVEMVSLLRDIRDKMECVEKLVAELQQYSVRLDDHNFRIERVERELELRNKR